LKCEDKFILKSSEDLLVVFMQNAYSDIFLLQVLAQGNFLLKENVKEIFASYLIILISKLKGNLFSPKTFCFGHFDLLKYFGIIYVKMLDDYEKACTVHSFFL
jgi:hypothetical protein